MDKTLELSSLDILALLLGLDALQREDVATSTGQDLRQHIESLRHRVAKFADGECRGDNKTFMLISKEDYLVGVNTLTPEREWDWIFQ